MRAQRGARGVRGRCFVVLLHRRGDGAPARLGVVASRKVGNAVTRNRGKRRVREWFRRLGDRAPRGFDVVVILRASREVSWAQICRELDGSLAKATSRASAEGSTTGGHARS